MQIEEFLETERLYALYFMRNLARDVLLKGPYCRLLIEL